MDPNIPQPLPQQNYMHMSPKVAVMLLAILALIVALFLFFALRREEARPEVPGKKKALKKEEQKEIKTNPTPAPSIYEDQYVIVDYPDDWVYIEDYLVNNSGKKITFQPSSLASGITIPSFSVSYDSDPTQLQDRVKTLEVMGLKRSAVSINNIPFIRVSGTSLDRVENDELIEKPMQVSYSFAKINGMTVVVKYLYDGSTVDPEMERFFAALISNTHFQNPDQ